MLVVDGTVLLACVVETPFSSAAAALLEEVVGDAALLVPQAALVEALEGARRLVQLGHMAAEDMAQLPKLLMPLAEVLAADAPLLEEAAQLALMHALVIPAALALALAQRRGARLATVDARLAEVARQVLGAERVVCVKAG